MPAASTVKPVVGVEDYALANTAADWNEGAVAATAPQNWADEGAAAPLAVAPAAPAPALDWAVCIFYFKLLHLILLTFNLFLFIFRLMNGMLHQRLVQPIPTGEVVLHQTGQICKIFLKE